MRLLALGTPVLAFLATAAGVSPTVTGHTATGHTADTAKPDASPAVTVFTNVNVVPMDREQVLTNQTVVVKNGRIAQIGPASSVHVPAGAFAIDGRGKYLLPGLADMHAHPFMGPHIATKFNLAGPFEVSAPWADSAGGEVRLFLWLANGATTIRDVDYADDQHANLGKTRVSQWALQLRARAAADTEWLPHIYTAGQFAPAQYLWRVWKAPYPVLDSVSTYVSAYKAAGYDFLKIHDETPDILDSIMVTAKRIGLPVIGHVPGRVKIEHILPYYKSIEHPLTEYYWSNTTGAKDTTGMHVLAAALAHADVSNCPTQSHYDRTHYDSLEPRPPKYLEVLHDAGVNLLLGTDETPWIGVITRELQAIVEDGLTPYQALQTGTSNVAKYFGKSSESGTIAVGKHADLLLLTGNPLQDVRYTAQPVGVMLGGRWLSRAEIDKRVAQLRLPMPNPNDPVQGYWANVMREAALSTGPVLYGIDSTNTLLNKFAALDTTQKPQRKALVDSLGHSDQYVSSTARVFGLIVKQLHDDRAMMTPSQAAVFDSHVAAWRQEYSTQLH